MRSYLPSMIAVLMAIAGGGVGAQAQTVCLDIRFAVNMDTQVILRHFSPDEGDAVVLAHELADWATTPGDTLWVDPWAPEEYATTLRLEEAALPVELAYKFVIDKPGDGPVGWENGDDRRVEVEDVAGLPEQGACFRYDVPMVYFNDTPPGTYDCIWCIDNVHPGYQAREVTDPVFRWTSFESEHGPYLLRVSHSPDLSNPVIRASVTDTTYDASGLLEPNTTYYWRVDRPLGDSHGSTAHARLLRFETAGAVATEAEAPTSASLTLAPNPAVNAVRVDAGPSWQEGTLEVFDVLGRLRMREPYQGATTLAVAGWEPGLYVVRLVADDAVAVQRVTIVRE